MKKQLGLVFIIAIIVGLGILLFSDQIEFERNETTEKYEQELYKISSQKVRELGAAAEGNQPYVEGAQTADDKKEQWDAEYIESKKDVFEGKEHLFESKDDADLTIDMKMFKQGEEYRFGDVFWNASLEQVKNIVPYSLLEDPGRTQPPEGYAYYVSEDKHDLYGQTATATYEFYEDQLKMVQLNFTPGDKKTKALFDSIVEALTDICGQENKKVENDATGHVGYQWKSENTMLQVETVDSRVIISVGLRESQ